MTEEKTYVPLRLGAQRKVWWPVSIRTGEKDGEEVRIRVLYSLRTLKEQEASRNTRSEIAEQQIATISDLLKNSKGADSKTLLLQIRVLTGTYQEVTEDDLVAHIHDWELVVDEDGKPVAFSKEYLRDLLAWGDVKLAFASGLVSAERGALSKN